jgi:hypothetical protein
LMVLAGVYAMQSVNVPPVSTQIFQEPITS